MRSSCSPVNARDRRRQRASLTWSMNRGDHDPLLARAPVRRRPARSGRRGMPATTFWRPRRIHRRRDVGEVGADSRATSSVAAMRVDEFGGPRGEQRRERVLGHLRGERHRYRLGQRGHLGEPRRSASNSASAICARSVRRSAAVRLQSSEVELRRRRGRARACAARWSVSGRAVAHAPSTFLTMPRTRGTGRAASTRCRPLACPRACWRSAASVMTRRDRRRGRLVQREDGPGVRARTRQLVAQRADSLIVFVAVRRVSADVRAAYGGVAQVRARMSRYRFAAQPDHGTKPMPEWMGAAAEDVRLYAPGVTSG